LVDSGLAVGRYPIPRHRWQAFGWGRQTGHRDAGADDGVRALPEVGTQTLWSDPVWP